MSNNFDLRKFLTENNLTTTAKAINEAPNMPPVPGSKPKMPPVPGQASKPDGTKMNPEMFAKFKEALKLLAQISSKPGGIPDGLATPLMKIMQTINADNLPANNEESINEYEQHYEIRNGECRRYNDEGEYTVVNMSYCR